MIYIYIDTTLKFMSYLNFKKHKKWIQIKKIFIYFIGVPLGLVRILQMQIVFWKWLKFIYSDHS